MQIPEAEGRSPSVPRHGEITPTERRFLGTVTRLLTDVLGDRLTGVYLSGSAALGDYSPATSDLDLAVVVRRPLDAAVTVTLAGSLLEVAEQCPVRGIELVVYPAATLGSWPPRWDVNVNAGPRMPSHVGTDPAAEPGFWFTLDLALVQSRGIALVGPPAVDVVPAPSDAAVAEALGESLAWHRENERVTANAVLNACRAWYWAACGRLTSKTEAAMWARPQVADPAMIDAALAWRESGLEAALHPAAVEALVYTAERALAARGGRRATVRSRTP